MMYAHPSPQLMVVLVGIPGSGKSTLARRLIESSSPTEATPAHWVRISQDVLGSRERCVSAAELALRNGQHVLVDRCNFDMTQRAHWINLPGASEAYRVAIVLHITQARALERVLQRAPHEGGVDSASMPRGKIESIVHKMYKNLHPPTTGEGFHEIFECRSDEPSSIDDVRARVNFLLMRSANSPIVESP